MKKSTVLMIFLFSTQVFGSLGTNVTNNEDEQLSKIVTISAYQIFIGTNIVWKDNGSETETPIQLAKCETTGLGGSTNRNICNNRH